LSFPATYNIRYYSGDVFEFVIRPKTSAGDPFPISDSTFRALFYISSQRGGSSEQTIEASAVIVGNNVRCTITPTIGNILQSGVTYFYDVSVENLTNANVVYTLLTGTINVTDDITSPSEEEE
jgi:hypothetical protein